jgi:hypothetical protein
MGDCHHCKGSSCVAKVRYRVSLSLGTIIV